jgi:peptidoglycan/xylan/chitin deacetylase (PgdA/CDA1 family)
MVRALYIVRVIATLIGGVLLLQAWVVPVAHAVDRTQCPSAQMRCEIAITFDDLPKVVPPAARAEYANEAYLTLTRLISTLRAHNAPAIGFVVGMNIDGADRDASAAMLRMWLRSGLTLGNHSYSHPNLCESKGNSFAEDVRRGEEVLRKAIRPAAPTTYFRFPYLCTGRTGAEKNGFANFLERNGWQNAPVTIEPGDYMFNELYLYARSRHDATLQQQIRDEYLLRVSSLLQYFEQVSRELFGRAIPQVLLIHSNDLNTDCLDDVLRTIEQRGYRFVTLDHALEDRAYRTADDYVGTMGISWLHRWKVALGKPLDYSTEPRIPSWLVYQVEKLHESH